MIRFTLRITYSGLLIFFIMGCQPPHHEGTLNQSSLLQNQSTKEIFQNYCTSCHGTQQPVLDNDLSDITNTPLMIEQGYIVPGDPDISLIFLRLSDSQFSMPPKGYPQPSPTEKLAIKNYIANLSNIDEEKEQILQPEFSKISKHVLEPYCISCHGPSLARKNIRLDSYDEVFKLITPNDPLNSKLYLIIQSGEMPEVGSVPSIQIDQIQKWIANGAENN